MKKPPKGIGLYLLKLKSDVKYESRLWNPVLGRIGKRKTWNEKDLSLVIQKHLAFKKEYEDNGYEIITSKPELKKRLPELVPQCAGLYYKYLCDDPELVPEQKAKHRDKKYIDNTTGYIKTFLRILKKNGYNLSHTHISAIDDKAVTFLYNHLEERFNAEEIGSVTWNRHITACRNWISTLIKEFGYKLDNPFYNITAKTEETDPEFLEMEELDKFLSVITPKNAWGTKGKKKVERVNHYRPGLQELYILDAFIGARPNELFILTWHNVIPNYVVVTNSKLTNNAKYKGKKEYVYIHPDLARVLAVLRSRAKSDDEYIIFPDWENRKRLQDFASKAFAHFFTQTDIKKEVTFYNLRHTYVNALYNLIGEEGLNLHHSKETAIKHYLSKKKKLDLQEGKRLFTIELDSYISA